MRLLVAASAISLALLTNPAAAQRGGDGQSRVYFWEDAYTYGWSDIVDPRYLDPPPRVIKKARVTVSELCGRLVGRVLRFDQSSRVYSIQMEDYCIRNGGKL